METAFEEIDDVIANAYAIAVAARTGSLNVDRAYDTAAQVLDLAAELDSTAAAETLRQLGSKLARVAGRMKAHRYHLSRQPAPVRAKVAQPPRREPTPPPPAPTYTEWDLVAPERPFSEDARQKREAFQTEQLRHLQRQGEAMRRAELERRAASQETAEEVEARRPWPWRRSR